METFEDLIKSYKIQIPIDKIDKDNYNYSSINNLLQKYNYNLDNISQDDFNIIKEHLNNLNKNETIEKITYNSIQIKSIELLNPRFTFFNILKELKLLVDITIKSTDIINKQLKIFEKERSVVKKLDITRDLFSIITNLNVSSNISVGSLTSTGSISSVNASFTNTSILTLLTVHFLLVIKQV